MSRVPAGRHLATGRLNLPRRFDIMSTIEYRVPFVRMLTDDGMQRLVVSLANLSYIDSMGIGTLISWERQCRDKGKALVLERCDPRILATFRLAGVAGLFQFA